MHPPSGSPAQDPSITPGSPLHIGEDTPSNAPGQAPASPQHIGEDNPSNTPGQAPNSPQHIGEDPPSKPGSGSGSTPHHGTKPSPNHPAPADSSPDYVSDEDLATKGKKVERAQFDAIDQGKKDKTYDPKDPNSYLPMDRRYTVFDDDPDLTPAESSNSGINPIMEHPDIGLDPNVPWTYREILSRGQNDNSMPTSIAMYSKDQRAIYVQSTYSVYDTEPSPESMDQAPKWKKGDPIPPRLPSGEILWQQYKDIAKDTAGELRLIAVHPIANVNTNRVIAKAHASKNIPADQKGTFEPPDSDWDTLLGDIWYTFLGTDNAKGIPFMTADHHTELRDKVVVKIHTWSPDRPGGVAMGAIVMELGPRK